MFLNVPVDIILGYYYNLRKSMLFLMGLHFASVLFVQRPSTVRGNRLFKINTILMHLSSPYLFVVISLEGSLYILSNGKSSTQVVAGMKTYCYQPLSYS